LLYHEASFIGCDPVIFGDYQRLGDAYSHIFGLTLKMKAAFFETLVSPTDRTVL
jgi:hypothetical protein